MAKIYVKTRVPREMWAVAAVVTLISTVSAQFGEPDGQTSSAPAAAQIHRQLDGLEVVSADLRSCREIACSVGATGR